MLYVWRRWNFGGKIRNRLGKNVRKPQGGIFWLALYVFDTISLLKCVKEMEVEKAEVEVDREQVMNEMREGKKEQEDLLVLLADQDTKLKMYRKHLKELGEKVNMLVYSLILYYFCGW